MSELEYRPCPLCRSEETEKFLRAPDRFALAEGEAYTLQRCLNCGMIFLNPRPYEADSGRYYQHAEYLPFASVASPRSLMEKLYAALRRVNLYWKKRLITRFHDRGIMLDAGCGTGELLAFMRARGWEVHGLERDAAAAEWGRVHLQLPIQTGSIDEIADTPEAYDVITMWHVLEHVYDPSATLRTLARLLKKEGVLIVAVPNIAGVDAKFYRQHWIALDVPRHVNHFSLSSLARCATQQGFTLRWWQQLPLDAFFNALLSERLQAAQLQSPAWLMPLRLLRAGVLALVSLVAGSHTPFTSAPAGATLVAVFEKASKQAHA